MGYRGHHHGLARILVQGIGPHVCHGIYSKFYNEMLGVYRLGRERGCLAERRYALRKGVSAAIAQGAVTG